MQLETVIDVARWRLCAGCGACVFVCEHKIIGLEDVHGQGIRPKLRGSVCKSCGKCLAVCPGARVAHSLPDGPLRPVKRLQSHWGPIMELWEGYAADPEIRKAGSSGGVASAIALYCLESGLAGRVLHVKRNEEQPWLNKTAISETRHDLLTRTGSRYSPASPCDSLGKIVSAASPCVFMGKPCDIQGLRNAEALKDELSRKVKVAIGIFCAGTPATAGILDLLGRLQISKDIARDIRFRGNGWPGSFSVRLKGEEALSHKLTYSESWGFLQAYRPFRCHLCPDGTSELADISCGDPWYRVPVGNDPGRSLVLVRTQKGRQILNDAVEAGYVCLERVDSEVLELSQKNLLMKRRAIWGRLAAMKAFGLPVPRYDGFPLFENWLELPLQEKARSIIGTAKRILQRKYYRPLP